MPALHVLDQPAGGGLAHAQRSAQGARHVLQGLTLRQQLIGELSPCQRKGAGWQSVRLFGQVVKRERPQQPNSCAVTSAALLAGECQQTGWGVNDAQTVGSAIWGTSS